MTRTRTILYFEPVAEIGGAEKLLLSLLPHLDRTRFRPAVAAIGRGPLPEAVRALGVPACSFPSHRVSRFPAAAAAVLWLAALSRRLGADWIHAQGAKAQIYGGPAARLSGARSLWHQHDPPPPGPGALHRLALAVPRDAVVVNSPATLAGLGRYLDVAAVPVVPPGVDLPPPIGPEEREAARTALGFGPRDFVILNVGRLQAFKGHRHLLAAVRRLVDSGLPARVEIAGGTLFGMEPAYPARLDSWIRELGLSERARRTGWLPESELRRLHAAADVLAHAALAEPFGLAVAEAMALGLPVVAFAAAGPSLLVEPERSGILVPVGDEAALAAAVLRLARDPEIARRLGAAARERVAERFTNERMAREFERIYEG